MGMCFFPTEFQGEYMTQSSSRGGVNLQYAPISILPESIPVWGVCHQRFGNRVILMDRYNNNNNIKIETLKKKIVCVCRLFFWLMVHFFIEFSFLIYLEIIFDRTGGTNWIRCFELTLIRSLNVVQIHTEGLDKCYTTEEAATATCPTDESIATGKSREITLF